MARSSTKSGAPPASSREAFFFKTQLCTFHLRGICAKGSACNFAHSDSEHRTCPNLAKTCLCQDWMNGSCALMAAECKFAHGGDDMRYTSLAALRGPPGTKVPLPSFIYKNWPTNTLHPARFERDGNVFMEKEPSKKHITNLTDSVPNQTQAVAAAERITTTVSTYLPQVSTSDRTYESEKKRLRWIPCVPCKFPQWIPCMILEQGAPSWQSTRWTRCMPFKQVVASQQLNLYLTS